MFKDSGIRFKVLKKNYKPRAFWYTKQFFLKSEIKTFTKKTEIKENLKFENRQH